MNKEVVIVSAVRTAVGSFGGSLKDTPTAQLGAIVIKEAINRAGIKPTDVDEVLMGCVLQAGLGQNVTRQASLQAGLPIETPALTINVVCGSGLKSVGMAATDIIAGEADCVVAGGMENMSAAPYVLPNARWGYRMSMPTADVVDVMVKDGLWEAFNDYHMGVTAENVAEKYGITREMQDAFSAESQRKCKEAQESGRFEDEIVPVPVKVKKETVEFKKDEFPRPGTTAEVLSKLRPAFKKDGTVTAGNASGVNDGAAAFVIMSADKAKELGVKPLARIVASAWAGVEPSIMGVGPVASTKKVLKKANMTLDDIDLIEANEAFAAQSIAVAKELNFDMAKVNVNGGAVSLGHPIGASGARILLTLLYELIHSGKKTVLATPVSYTHLTLPTICSV